MNSVVRKLIKPSFAISCCCLSTREQRGKLLQPPPPVLCALWRFQLRHLVHPVVALVLIVEWVQTRTYLRTAITDLDHEASVQ